MNATDLLTKQDLINFKKELFDLLKPITEKAALQDQKWLRSKEVRTLLNISSATLQNLRTNGTISHRKIGGIFYYKHADIEKLLNRPEKKSPKKK